MFKRVEWEGWGKRRRVNSGGKKAGKKKKKGLWGWFSTRKAIKNQMANKAKQGSIGGTAPIDESKLGKQNHRKKSKHDTGKPTTQGLVKGMIYDKKGLKQYIASWTSVLEELWCKNKSQILHRPTEGAYKQRSQGPTKGQGDKGQGASLM